MINLLTLFHKAVLEVYRVYADSKGYMNFGVFMTFCSDYDVFPEVITKASLYRIFHSLSFINDMIGGVNQSTMSFNKNSSRAGFNTSKFSMKSQRAVE